MSKKLEMIAHIEAVLTQRPCVIGDLSSQIRALASVTLSISFVSFTAFCHSYCICNFVRSLQVYDAEYQISRHRLSAVVKLVKFHQ